EEEPLLHGRQIARTRVSERVRRIIADARAARAQRRQRVAQRIADRESSMSEEAFSGPSSSLTTPRRRGTKRKRTTRKRKTPTKKRKTTRKRKTTKKKTPGKKTKRKKRKTKGKGKSPKTPASSAAPPGFARTAQSSASVKGRIADRLGLKPPPSGRSIPIQKGSGTGGSGGPLRHEAAPSFSIMGSKDELYSFA
ncbi:PHD and RING finger domain containing protein 1, partial [Plakobranchus ocellatus]